VTYQRLQLERNALQLQTPRFDLREVEHVVDQGEKRLAGSLHQLEILAPLLGRRRLDRQLRHPEDAVDRRSNLVRHVREELALGPARALGRLFRRLQLLLHLLAIGRVTVVQHRRIDRRVVEPVHRQHLDVPPAQSRVPEPEYSWDRPPRMLQRVEIAFVRRVVVLGMDEIEKRTPLELIGAIAEDPDRGGAHVRQLAAAIDQEDPVGAVLHEGAKAAIVLGRLPAQAHRFNPSRSTLSSACGKQSGQIPWLTCASECAARYDSSCCQ